MPIVLGSRTCARKVTIKLDRPDQPGVEELDFVAFFERPARDRIEEHIHLMAAHADALMARTQTAVKESSAEHVETVLATERALYAHMSDHWRGWQGVALSAEDLAQGRDSEFTAENRARLLADDEYGVALLREYNQFIRGMKADAEKNSGTSGAGGPPEAPRSTPAPSEKPAPSSA